MRELLQNSFVLKIFSLILATLLWFAIEANLQKKTGIAGTPFSEEGTLDLNCPVAALVAATSQKSFQISPLEVAVSISGKPEVLSGIDSSGLTVFVKVPANLDSQESLPLDVKLPSSIRLLTINPPEVTVTPRIPN